MGYGPLHKAHYAYRSMELPAKQPPSFFEERPCVFPLYELPPLEQRPTGDLLALSYAEQQQHSDAFKRKVASHMGYGAGRKPGYFAYTANTYWREGSTTQRPADSHRGNAGATDRTGSFSPQSSQPYTARS